MKPQIQAGQPGCTRRRGWRGGGEESSGKKSQREEARAPSRGSRPTPSLPELRAAAGGVRARPHSPPRPAPPPTPAPARAGAAAARGAPGSAGRSSRARRSRAPPPPRAPLRGPRRAPPPLRTQGARRTGGRAGLRASAPRRRPPPRPSPAAGSRRPGLGIKPAARAAAPGGGGLRAGGDGRPPPPRAPGTTHRELGRRPAVRARGCRERRCWALGRTGLAPPPPPLVANADLKPGERAEALKRPPPPPRARRPGPRGVFICHGQGGGRLEYSPSPEGWRGGRKLGTARARPQ